MWPCTSLRVGWISQRAHPSPAKFGHIRAAYGVWSEAQLCRGWPSFLVQPSPHPGRSGLKSVKLGARLGQVGAGSRSLGRHRSSFGASPRRPHPTHCRALASASPVAPAQATTCSLAAEHPANPMSTATAYAPDIGPSEGSRWARAFRAARNGCCGAMGSYECLGGSSFHLVEDSVLAALCTAGDLTCRSWSVRSSALGFASAPKASTRALDSHVVISRPEISLQFQLAP